VNESRISTFLLSSKEVASRILHWIGRHPSICLSLPSIYLLLFYPILWKDIDALGQLIWPAGTTNILHYPPIYCFSARIPFWVGGLVQAAFSGRQLPPLDILSEQRPSLIGLHILILAQHLALVFALSIFVKTTAQTESGRGVVTLCLLSTSCLYAQQQCAGSESLSVSAIILMAAFGLRAFEKHDAAAWIAFTLATFVVVGTRHVNIIFAIWLPGTLAGLLIWRALRQRPFDPALLVRLTICILSAFVVLLANAFLAKTMIQSLGQEYHSTLGLTLSDRIEVFTDKLSISEKQALVAKLLAAERDPIVRLAITTQAENGSLHRGSATIIKDAVAKEGHPPLSVEAATDRAILKEALGYLTSFHPKLIRIILADFGHGYLRVDNGKLSLNRFLSNQTAARMRQANPQQWAPLDNLGSLDYSKAHSEVHKASRDLYLTFGGPIPIIVLVIANIFVGTVLAGRGHSETALLALSLLVTSSILYFVNCICVYYNDRYTLPLFVCNIAALGIQLGRFIDDNCSRRKLLHSVAA
jgi:hypothetical protein